jgi:1-acyl-sn-glycerol-3-phosphate acyltransferase
MRLTVFNTPFLTGFLRIISSIGLRTIGWHAQGRDITHSKFVLIAAPHTSNWDFPLMLMVILKLRLRVFWMGKHTLFPFGFAWFMKYLGGIPINRSKSHNVVNETIKLFETHEKLIVLIPPEGTRSKVKHWKSGFYRIARGANVPVLLGHVDAEKKIAKLDEFFFPSDDLDADMKKIRAFYAAAKGLITAKS